MIGRFIRGSTIFDVATAPFAPGEDFVPPAAAMEYNLAPGTSANVYGGATKISEKANNTEWSFSVRVITSTAGPENVEQQVRRLVNFLKRSTADPLYFEYSPFDLPEPLWGQFGAARRYECVTADADIAGDIYTDKTLRRSAARGRSVLRSAWAAGELFAPYDDRVRVVEQLIGNRLLLKRGVPPTHNFTRNFGCTHTH